MNETMIWSTIAIHNHAGKGRLIKTRGRLWLLGVLLFSPCALAQAPNPVVLAAGDIAQCNLLGLAVGAERTARLLDQEQGVILALGDLVYGEGTREQFRDCYNPTWGRHKERTWPVPGNHEYRTPNAEGYFAYWDNRAAFQNGGYQSFTLGSWHLIALNSSLKNSNRSRQLKWLQRELANSDADCVLAYWHHPVFSSHRRGGTKNMQAAFEILYDAGASIVLAGHDHVYERFAPQDPQGKLDIRRGVRAFIVGTGGARLYNFAKIHHNSAFRYNESWGVLRLNLMPKSYQWNFLTVHGERLDQGYARCVDRP